MKPKSPAPNGEVAVRVTPRSSRTGLELDGESVRIWVTAAPTDGMANDAVCRLLAERVGVPPSSVSVRRGHKGRDKVLAVEGITSEEIRLRLMQG